MLEKPIELLEGETVRVAVEISADGSSWDFSVSRE
jgi:hypothetical protein